jgi:hypothetical protein
MPQSRRAASALVTSDDPLEKLMERIVLILPQVSTTIARRNRRRGLFPLMLSDIRGSKNAELFRMVGSPPLTRIELSAWFPGKNCSGF